MRCIRPCLPSLSLYSPLPRRFRQVLSIVLAVFLLVSGNIFPIAADTGDAPQDRLPLPELYIQRGLVSFYSGTQNRRDTHDPSSDVWEDLVGDNDVPLTINGTNGFTPDGFHLRAEKNFFPQELVDLVNGSEFTVELRLKDFLAISPDYAPLLNCSNDSLSLFLRGSNRVLELKYAANAPSVRPTVANGDKLLQDALISVSYTVGGSCVIYLNGVRKTVTDAPLPAGVNDLFFGHDEAHRQFEAVYRSLRFYRVALTEPEIRHNACLDGYLPPDELYIPNGLVSQYSGFFNTRHGMDLSSPVWEDLVGQHDLPLTLPPSGTDGFRKNGLLLCESSQIFPETLTDLVNSGTFTMEILFGEIEAGSKAMHALFSSQNGNFALQYDGGNDTVEFRFTDQPKGKYPAVETASERLSNGLLTLTFEEKDKCCLYLNGEAVSDVDAPVRLNADRLVLGRSDPSGEMGVLFSSIRFYNRVLMPQEIRQNAASDGCAQPEESAFPRCITVAQPTTNIIGDIALVRDIRSDDDLKQLLLADQYPAAMILSINRQLEIVDQDGQVLSDPEQILTETGFSILPVFRLPDRETASAVTDYLNAVRFTDVMFLSRDMSVIELAKQALPAASTVIDYTEAYASTDTLTEEQCLDIRRSLKAHNGTIALLPASLCRQETVQYLFDRQVNVWAWASGSPTETDMYGSILSGAVGIVADDTDTFLKIACEELPSGTMTRVPLIIGHRGLPGQAPENTLEGAILAYENGADVIELDVYLTKDRHPVIMHDATTGRTCNRNLSVEGSTLAELKELYVNRGFPKDSPYASCRIPTLDEFLAWFKGKPCNLFIEVKTVHPLAATVIREAVEKQGMYGQCSVITFHESVMADFRKAYPEMSLGALCSGYASGSHPETDLRAAAGLAGRFNGTINPYFGGYDRDDARAALLRGISLYPWTFEGGVAAYASYLTGGFAGLTGNDCQSLKNLTKSIHTEIPGHLSVGQDIPTALSAETFGRRTRNTNRQVVWTVLEGRDLLKIGEDALHITGAGDITLLPSLEVRSGGAVYRLFRQPIRLTAEASETPPVEETDTLSPDTPTLPEETDGTTLTDTSRPDPSEPEPDTEHAPESGCRSFLSPVAAGIVVLLAPVLIRFRRKAEKTRSR